MRNAKNVIVLLEREQCTVDRGWEAAYKGMQKLYPIRCVFADTYKWYKQIFMYFFFSSDGSAWQPLGGI